MWIRDKNPTFMHQKEELEKISYIYFPLALATLPKALCAESWEDV